MMKVFSLHKKIEQNIICIPNKGTFTGHNEIYNKKIINEFRNAGINIISYFINAGSIWESDRSDFTTMYGADSNFINPESMLDISKSINAKFLEMAE